MNKFLNYATDIVNCIVISKTGRHTIELAKIIGYIEKYDISIVRIVKDCTTFIHYTKMVGLAKKIKSKESEVLVVFEHN